MKLLWAVLLLASLLAFFIFFLFFHFDPEPFRPDLERAFSKGFRLPVKIERVSLGPQFPPAVNFFSFEILDKNEKERCLWAASAKAELDLRALFAGRVEVKNLIFNAPELYFHHMRDGLWNWNDRSRSPSGSLAAPADQYPRSIIKFPPPSTVQIIKGKLDYRDEVVAPSFSFQLNFLDGVLEHTPFSDVWKLNAGATLPFGANPEFLLEANYQPARGTVLFELHQKDNRLKIEGEIEFSSRAPRYKALLEARGLEMGNWVPETLKHQEYLSGALTARLEAFGEGIHPEQFKQTLSLEGPMDVRDGAFHHLNFVQAVLAGLAPLPGFSRQLAEKLTHTPYAALLKDRDMPYDLFRARLQMNRGKVVLQQALLTHEAYLVEGEGSWDLLQKEVDFMARLVLMEDFSRRVANQAKEFIPLLNAQGRIVLPFKYRGLLPGASVYPDLNYVAKQFFQQQGQELVSAGEQFLSKFWESKKS